MRNEEDHRHIKSTHELQIASQIHVKIKIRGFQSEGKAIIFYEV